MSFNKLVLILINIFCLSCAQTKPQKQFVTVRSQYLMGTKATIYGLESNEDFNLAFKAIKDVEQKLSTYIKSSAVTKLNLGQKITVSPDLQLYFKQAADIQDRSLGYFSPTLGAYTKPFKKHNNFSNQTSSKTQLSPIIEADKLVLPKGVQFDFGGIGKGIGIWRASQVISGAKQPVVIKMSGDIYCHQKCNFIIESPTKTNPKLNYKTCGTKHSISTSGNYRNFIKTKSNNHIINPKTRRSQSETSSVTVVTSEPSYVADGLATALAAATKKTEREKIIKNFQASYLHISNNNKLEYGFEFENYFCQ